MAAPEECMTASGMRKRGRARSSGGRGNGDSTPPPFPKPSQEQPRFMPEAQLPWTLLGFFGLCFVIPTLLFLRLEARQVQWSITENTLLSLAAFIATFKIIPVLAVKTKLAGLHGVDKNKARTDLVPESLGLASSAVTLVSLVLFETYLFNYSPGVMSLAEYNAGLASICFMILLGFADDVLDLRWRYKLLFPAFAALPLLMAYSGATAIVIPIPLRPLIGMRILELGIFYKLYMLLLTIFCTNSINIFAGINGLEAGQALVIACAVITHNLVEIGLSGPVGGAHLFSLFLMLPFIFTTAAFLLYNWHPSRVFPGDTFTYYAGMQFAVAAILCHYSKTLLLFFTPQILNFLYGLPQLFGFIPCPRHRLPRYNKETGKLEGVRHHLNLLNLSLLVLGPMSERTACLVLLGFQILCCAIGFVVRYHIASFFYEADQ